MVRHRARVLTQVSKATTQQGNFHRYLMPAAAGSGAETQSEFYQLHHHTHTIPCGLEF